MGLDVLGGTTGVRIRRAIIGVVALALGTIPTVGLIHGASAASGCSVTYTVANQWNTGFTVQGITIVNLGGPLSSWTLTFSFPGNQTLQPNPWNGSFTQSGSQVTVTNVSYNGSVGANGTVSPAPGFNGNYSGSNPSPTSFSLNGTVCGGGPTPTPTPNPTPTPTPSGTPSPSPSGSPSPHPANPYAGASFYLNPDFQAEVNTQASADSSSTEARVANFQTGIWMDHIGAITGDSTHMGLGAQLNRAASEVQGTTPELVEVVIYDLPGRDCAALASNGEIPATSAGLTQYEQSYITPIAQIEGSSAFSSLRIVNIIEPDSLPNVVTNQGIPACATATPFYEQGIEFALNHLHAIPWVWNFMDIAHSAWLGWPNNMSNAGPVYASVAKATTAGFASIDGFISDTANYTPTVEPFLTNPTMQVGGQQLDSVQFYQSNPTFDENTYDGLMWQELVNSGFPSSIGFLIDTSRNGWGGSARPTALNSSPTTASAYVAANKVDQRPFRGDWCNQNGAGIGARPQATPSGVNAHVFAFVWIKPPGESDGDYPTSTHSHGDPHCDPGGTNTDGSGNTYPTGSIPSNDVPAGQWFPAEFQMLVSNANPAIQ